MCFMVLEIWWFGFGKVLEIFCTHPGSVMTLVVDDHHYYDCDYDNYDDKYDYSYPMSRDKMKSTGMLEHIIQWGGWGGMASTFWVQQLKSGAKACKIFTIMCFDYNKTPSEYQSTF